MPINAVLLSSPLPCHSPASMEDALLLFVMILSDWF